MRAFFEVLRRSSIKNLKKTFLKNKERNSFFSSVQRTFLKFQIPLKIYLNYTNSINLKHYNEFLRIRIGFLRRRFYLPFLNIDPYLINNSQLCLSPINLPFKKETCQEIYIKYFFKYLKKKHFKRLLRRWYKILIPGGFLKIEFLLKNNESNFGNLIKKIIENNFRIYNIDESNLRFNGTILLHVIKKKPCLITQNILPLTKFQNIISILKENKDLFNGKKNICILGKRAKIIKEALNIKNIEVYESIKQFSEVPDNCFDFCIISNFFEFNYYWIYNEIFSEIRRKVKMDSPILIVLPNKKNFYQKEYLQLFEKGIITEKIDENNFVIDWINLSSSLKMIQILLKNQYENPQTKNNIKVCLLGSYTLRYSLLNNATWDGQIRAFEKLGYNTLVLDIKDNSFNYILKRIIDFKPDILWTTGSGFRGFYFLINKSDFFKNSEICVVSWWTDSTVLMKYDFNQIIDYMFVVSKTQIPFYKNYFNIKKVYFMSQFAVPQILHRNEHIKEKYDIGFSGALDYTKDHITRTVIIKNLKKKFNVKTVQKVYNNLPEFYSQCKIIFGGAPDLMNFELATSNRFFMALSCGSCYITNYFKGIEKFGGKEKHLLWYKNESELEDLIKKYLSDEELRLKIMNNAEKLFKLKHNHIVRTQNMLDIINNKTEEFYGFIT